MDLMDPCEKCREYNEQMRGYLGGLLKGEDHLADMAILFDEMKKEGEGHHPKVASYMRKHWCSRCGRMSVYNPEELEELRNSYILAVRGLQMENDPEVRREILKSSARKGAVDAYLKTNQKEAPDAR